MIDTLDSARIVRYWFRSLGDLGRVQVDSQASRALFLIEPIRLEVS